MKNAENYSKKQWRKSMEEHSSERGRLLLLAKSLTEGDRNESYGDPFENHKRIAEIYTAITGEEGISATRIALVQIATKLSRMQQDAYKEDSYVDLLAYVAILWECAQAEKSVLTMDGAVPPAEVEPDSAPGLGFIARSGAAHAK